MNIVLGLIGVVVDAIMLAVILEKWIIKERETILKDHKDQSLLRFYCAVFALYFPIVFLVGIMGGYPWVGPICFVLAFFHFFSLDLPSRNEPRKKVIRKLSKNETTC